MAPLVRLRSVRLRRRRKGFLPTSATGRHAGNRPGVICRLPFHQRDAAIDARHLPFLRNPINGRAPGLLLRAREVSLVGDEEEASVTTGNRREFLLKPLLAIGGVWLASRSVAEVTTTALAAVSSSNPATVGATALAKEDVIVSRVYYATVIGEPNAKCLSMLLRSVECEVPCHGSAINALRNDAIGGPKEDVPPFPQIPNYGEKFIKVEETRGDLRMKKSRGSRVRTRVVWDEANLVEIESNKPVR